MMGGGKIKRRKKSGRLKRISEEQALANLRPKPRPGEPYRRTLRAAGMGHSQHGVGWYRGQHAGQIDAIVTLHDMGLHRVAERLRKRYGMDEEGNIVL
jgi:hypothetical protein